MDKKIDLDFIKKTGKLSNRCLVGYGKNVKHKQSTKRIIKMPQAAPVLDAGHRPCEQPSRAAVRGRTRPAPLGQAHRFPRDARPGASDLSQGVRPRRIEIPAE